MNLYAHPWLKQLRSSDYQRYLDEVAEMMLAQVKAWEEDWGAPPAFVMPFNEPTSGNKELNLVHSREADREMADMLKRGGKRLRDAGYKNVSFVFPNQETIDISRETVEHVLADPDARECVGRIGYHEYPYRSPMTSVRKILLRADSDGAEGVAESRTRLNKLAQSYRIPLWMTEVSHGGVEMKQNGIECDFRDFRLLRGRANHIQSEFAVTGASAFFGMNNVWSRKATNCTTRAGEVTTARLRSASSRTRWF